MDLEYCLRCYVESEVVHGVECPSCGQGKSFVKQMHIGRAPTSLCLHISRTVWLPDGTLHKSTTSVSFPSLLDLSTFMSNKQRYLDVCVCERERETGRERDTKREIDRQTDRQTEKEKRERDRHRERERMRDREREREKGEREKTKERDTQCLAFYICVIFPSIHSTFPSSLSLSLLAHVNTSFML